MKCNYPLHLTSPEGSVYDVPCGRCLGCRINRTSAWTIRILHESRCHNDNVFVTLTYRDDSLPENKSLSKRDLQLFFKRLRRNYSQPIRYFACGEYGETNYRPHYHIILFGVSNDKRELILNTWNKGLVDKELGSVTEQSARYVASYCQKQLFKHKDEYKESGREKEFILTSRRPGIGALYAEKFISQWIDNGYIVVNGIKRPIPRYYLNRENERGLV